MPENKKRPKALKVYLAKLDIAAIKDELIIDLHLINKILEGYISCYHITKKIYELDFFIN